MHIRKNLPFPARARCALQGILAAARSEQSLRIQLGALVVAAAGLAWFRLEPLWWALVAASCAAVISAELLNTALEHLADHLHPDIHPQIRIVKDCAAAAVLVACLGAAAVAVAAAFHVVGRQ